MPSYRSCLQWTIIIFNTSCVIFGILGVVESVFELQKYNYGSPDYTEKIVQIIIGTVLVISAFIGCCGAVHGSVKMLILFITILFALIAGHIWKLWRYDELRVKTTTEVMVSYTWVEELVERGKMNSMQEAYVCCGKYGYTDYTNNFMKVPDSCYYFENNKKSFYPHDEGCISAVSRAYLSIYRLEKWAHISLIGFEICAIIYIIIMLVTYDNEQKTHGMVMNYITMIMSAICCAAAVMESFFILQIIGNIFLSKIVVTIVLGVYKISPLSLYTFFAIILHSAITCLAYYMAQKIQQTKLNNLISKYTGVAAIPLNPPPHVRSDVI